MKYIFILFLGSILFASCGDSIKPGLDKQISGTDSIKIYFLSEKDNTTQRVVTISDKSDIANIIASITDEKSEQYKCGYTGQMEFYEKGKIILSPEFNSNPECAHYVFRYKDKMYHKKMSQTGQDLFTKPGN